MIKVTSYDECLVTSCFMCEYNINDVRNCNVKNVLTIIKEQNNGHI
jgi:hypothetical protein